MPGTLKTAPGTLHPVVQLMAFNTNQVLEQTLQDLNGISRYLNNSFTVWINVDGFGDTSLIRQLGEMFKLHPLAMEDVINAHQRAKVEPYEDQLFIVTRWVSAMEHEHPEAEQISLFLGKNYVLTFQERPGDCFDPVRERIRGARGRIRDAGADYLAYTLIDAVIDSYFPVMDRFVEHLDKLEDEVTIHVNPAVTEQIHEIRNDLLLLRRSIRPHREALNELVRDLHPLISNETRVFLRDCYDHTVQLIDLLEVYREMCNDLRDYYLSLVSNRMNEVMKVLTIIATIFIPLSFIAGVYGMNFNTGLPGNMPELNWPYGYLMSLSMMLATTIGMLVYFWRSGWIGTGRRSRKNLSS